LKPGSDWFKENGWEVFPFQKKAWDSYCAGKNGIVNAPTGSGKTYSLLVPVLLKNNHVNFKGLRAIWITPIRALSKEILSSANRLIQALNLNWTVGVRTGDTSQAERARQKKQLPNLLITTPESLHILLAQKGYDKAFTNLEAVVVDEWHELLGSKRGVQMELGLSRLRAVSSKMQVWGISATIGNMEQAMEVLLGNEYSSKGEMIISGIQKRIEVVSLIPDNIETMAWSGHLGVAMMGKVVDIIRKHNSTLIFTNTRAQAEIWYHHILEKHPEMAGVMAMHHSAISRELRFWVEDALFEGNLKAVVCTSSLDLGVDFRPVDAIIQIGGPKGVARFVQRAGRSGHQPGATSKIYFLPTQVLELIEGAALRQAVEDNYLENRIPYVRSFDVLIQYLCTLAVSNGFDADEIYGEVVSTFSFSSIDRNEWNWCLGFIHSGGLSLQAYPDFRKVEVDDGFYKIKDRRIARKHLLSIGTIVGDQMLAVKYHRGSLIGHIEEFFIAGLKEGETFWFAGRSLELLRIKEMTVFVKNSDKKSGKIPSWQGGRLNLSSNMSDMLRLKLNSAVTGNHMDPELTALKPVLEIQAELSHLPSLDEFLIEQIQTKEGYHVFMYPFEGRFVHEGLASLLAYRIGLLNPMSFSLAFNDYGFELLSDQPINIDEAFDSDFLSAEHLMDDLEASINSAEMARRKFRDIAVISGMVFQGYPGKYVKNRHLQSSSSLFFDVFTDYEPNNLLFRQAFDEMIDHQIEIDRLRQVMNRLNSQKLVITHPSKPTPFAFPIMVDRLRAKNSSETLTERIQKMKLDFNDS
jgi:ATP-dependent helicase Lhr and Lhr-like helicase